jgi:nicotinamide phosphoribosyltransferase
MEHNGCFLVRGDSGDCVEVVTQTVFKLWEHFGGTINSKGYKVLDPHVKAIYGDSITIQRCRRIYEILEENGFACSNVALGVGSFSFQCVEEDGILKPFTRDTFSSCIKATYCEIDGKPYPIFKDPKDGGFKKSQKGCCVVHPLLKSGTTRKTEISLTYLDERTWEEACNDKYNLLTPVFRNSEMLWEQNLQRIRNKLHEGEF